MPVLIFGGILTGVFTATEAGAVAVAYGLLVGVAIYRVIDARRLYAILLETARVSGQIMLLVGAASLFAWLLSSQRVPQELSALIQSITTGPVLFLLLANLVMLVLGAVLDGLPAMIMLVPVLLPMAIQFNVDPLHFGIVLIANIGVGLFLPPVGAGADRGRRHRSGERHRGRARAPAIPGHDDGDRARHHVLAVADPHRPNRARPPLER